MNRKVISPPVIKSNPGYLNADGDGTPMALCFTKTGKWVVIISATLLAVGAYWLGLKVGAAPGTKK